MNNGALGHLTSDTIETIFDQNNHERGVCFDEATGNYLSESMLSAIRKQDQTEMLKLLNPKSSIAEQKSEFLPESSIHLKDPVDKNYYEFTYMVCDGSKESTVTIIRKVSKNIVGNLSPSLLCDIVRKFEDEVFASRSQSPSRATFIEFIKDQVKKNNRLAEDEEEFFKTIVPL